MIIGKGDIASVLKDRDGFIFFASGVSNSQETRETEYQREKDLLMNQDKGKHLVYFGSLSIYYARTRYSQHKMEMEQLIKDNFKHYTIMRLGNITWGTNPNTIINAFRNKIARREPIEIQNTFRYIIDLGEFLHWVSVIPKWNSEMNITGKRMSIRQIVEELV